MESDFLSSSKSAREFIETITSSAISSVTDTPPETRIKKPEDDVDIVDVL